MTCSRGGGGLSVLVAHVARAALARDAVAAARRWAAVEPVLSRFDSPAAIASACRRARGAERDRVVSALLAVSPGDEWAQLTVLAGLADRLGCLVATWAWAGVRSVEVADMEAELIASCWAAIASFGELPPPARPAVVLVDRAWAQVRTSRRRSRRRADRETPLPDQLPAVAGPERPTLEVLAGQVTSAVTAERLRLRAARAVYLTRWPATRRWRRAASWDARPVWCGSCGAEPNGP